MVAAQIVIVEYPNALCHGPIEASHLFDEGFVHENLQACSSRNFSFSDYSQRIYLMQEISEPYPGSVKRMRAAKIGRTVAKSLGKSREQTPQQSEQEERTRQPHHQDATIWHNFFSR